MNQLTYNLSDLEPILKHTLSEGGTFRFYPRGTSMLPTIKEGRDQVLLTSVPEKLEKYQIILYKRKDGTFVLHRIVKIKGDTYVMCGDNQYILETGILREQMLGLVCGIVQDGETIDPESKEQRRKAAVWVETRTLRKKLIRMRGYLWKIKRCIKR